jgi:hypothetical protein
MVKQELAYRGHDENDINKNNGIFSDLLNLFSQNDKPCANVIK